MTPTAIRRRRCAAGMFSMFISVRGFREAFRAYPYSRTMRVLRGEPSLHAPRAPADNVAHGGIDGQSHRVVYIQIACQAAIDRLPQGRHEWVMFMAEHAAVVKRVLGHFDQPRPLIKGTSNFNFRVALSPPVSAGELPCRVTWLFVPGRSSGWQATVKKKLGFEDRRYRTSPKRRNVNNSRRIFETVSAHSTRIFHWADDAKPMATASCTQRTWDHYWDHNAVQSPDFACSEALCRAVSTCRKRPLWNALRTTSRGQ